MPDDPGTGRVPNQWFSGGRTGQDRERGLYDKYRVERIDGRAEKHEGCAYFVLDLTHDKFAPAALAVYADQCEAEFPALARDLRRLVEDSGHA